MTHDSIGLGEDGPTHQPVEHLAICRATPNTLMLRPCDLIETAEAWGNRAVQRKHALGAGAVASEPAAAARKPRART